MRGMRGEGSQGHIVDVSNVARLAGFQAAVQRIEFYTAGNTPVCGTLPMGQSLEVRVHFVLDKPRDNVEVGLGFDNMFGQRIFTAHTSFEPARSYQQQVGSQTYVCSIPRLTLVPGQYTIRVWVDGSAQSIDLVDDAARIQIIESDYYGTGRVPWNGTFVLEHHWYLEQGIPAR
jgi:hypothetical protein